MNGLTQYPDIALDISSGFTYTYTHTHTYIYIYGSSDIVSDIVSGICCDILPGIYSDACSGILSGIIYPTYVFDSLPCCLSGIYSDIPSGVLSDIYFEIRIGSLPGNHSGILPGACIRSGFLFGLLSGILFWHSVFLLGIYTVEVPVAQLQTAHV